MLVISLLAAVSGAAAAQTATVAAPAATLRPSVEKHPNASQAEFGFLEAVRHCNVR
jgi:hypothetical protein